MLCLAAVGVSVVCISIFIEVHDVSMSLLVVKSFGNQHFETHFHTYCNSRMLRNVSALRWFFQTIVEYKARGRDILAGL